MSEFFTPPDARDAGLIDRLRRADRPAGRAQRSHVAPTLQVVWARHLDDVRAAQRLRHQVFVDEMGARPTPVAGAPAGHDIDLFDEFCEHLIVRTRARQRRARRGGRHLPRADARRRPSRRQLLQRHRVRPHAPAPAARPHGGTGPQLRASRSPLGRRHPGPVGRAGASSWSATPWRR